MIEGERVVIGSYHFCDGRRSLPPATSVLLHNASTLAIVLKSMTALPV